MNTLQSVLIVAAAVLLVLALCSGIKAACRKILSSNKSKRVRKTDEIQTAKKCGTWRACVPSAGKAGKGHKIHMRLM